MPTTEVNAGRCECVRGVEEGEGAGHTQPWSLRQESLRGPEAEDKAAEEWTEFA